MLATWVVYVGTVPIVSRGCVAKYYLGGACTDGSVRNVRATPFAKETDLYPVRAVVLRSFLARHICKQSQRAANRDFSG
jgi:hypothetical protein